MPERAKVKAAEAAAARSLQSCTTLVEPIRTQMIAALMNVGEDDSDLAGPRDSFAELTVESTLRRRQSMTLPKANPFLTPLTTPSPFVPLAPAPDVSNETRVAKRSGAPIAEIAFLAWALIVAIGPVVFLLLE